MSRFDKLVNSKLCLGCGLCESLGQNNGYKMRLCEDGFWRVQIPKSRDLKLEKQITKCCPSIELVGVGDSEIWGHYIRIIRAYSNDNNTRFVSSSGGIVTETCCYLLDNKIVDAVLQVGVSNEDYLTNELRVARTTEEVKANSSSRYAPALMFNKLKQLLDSSTESFAFVGKSCDVLCVNNFENQYPIYKGRIKYKVAILCAGMPSLNATVKIENSNVDRKYNIASIRYRGNGWPGTFTVKYQDGSKYCMDYENAWMNYLGRYLHHRCKICPDSVGTIADILVGDAWEIKDNAPSFEERPGVSLVIIRNEKADHIVINMEKQGFITSSEVAEHYLNTIQPNHVRKRTSSGFKIASTRLLSPGLLRNRQLKLMHLMVKYNILRGIRDFWGSLKRYRKWKQ